MFQNGARWKNLNVLIPSKLNLNCFDKSVLGESWNKRRYSTHIYINKRITREYKKQIVTYGLKKKKKFISILENKRVNPGGK